MTIIVLQVAALVVFAWLLRGLTREGSPRETGERADHSERH
jgi:hypothetical protein